MHLLLAALRRLDDASGHYDVCQYGCHQCDKRFAVRLITVDYVGGLRLTDPEPGHSFDPCTFPQWAVRTTLDALDRAGLSHIYSWLPGAYAPFASFYVAAH